jgi:hypothetical protein
MGETMIFFPRQTFPMTDARGCTYVEGSMTGSVAFAEKSVTTFFPIMDQPPHLHDPPPSADRVPASGQPLDG